MIKAVNKALDIIEFLARDNQREFYPGEIADALKMDHGTCSNIIKTLAVRGYVQQDAPRHGYRLGYSVFHLVGADIANEDIVKIAREDIMRLGDKFNEVAILSVIRNDRRIILYQTVPDRDLTVRSTQGKPVYCANTARAILANYSPSHLEKFLIRVGLPGESEWPEVTRSANPRGTLINLLSEIRLKGYSVQHGDNGIDGFSAPIFRKGHVVGGVGVYLPGTRIADEEELIQAVCGCAAEINRKMNLTDKLCMPSNFSRGPELGFVSKK